MSNDCELIIRMESDWRVGLGAGGEGGADRQVLRDHDGLPYLPAKTVTGLWRDGCEMVAQALDDIANRACGDDDDDKQIGWRGAVADIFGAQPPDWGDVAQKLNAHAASPARLSVRPARFSPELCAAVAHKPALRAAFCFLQPGVKIDSDSGRAQDNHLYFSETARAGAELTAKLELGEGLGEKHLALLWAGAKAVRRIGGDRRRGKGRCRLELRGAVWDDPSKRWRDLLDPENPPERLIQHTPKHPDDRPADDDERCPEATAQAGGWQALDYRLEANTPLVAVQTVAGNVVKSLDYVPGTMLLGHLGQALRAATGQDPDKGDMAVRRWIADGRVALTNAYPEVDGQPSLPAPMAFERPKEDAADCAITVRNSLLASSGDAGKQGEDGGTPGEKVKQYKALRGGYVAQGDASATLYHQPSLGLNMHNTIKDEKQRPSQQVGGLYAYQHIRAGARLRGQIRLAPELAYIATDQTKRQKLREALNKSIRVGRSKKDDYGQAQFTLLDDAPSEALGGRAAPNESADGKLVVWLLSDLLARDELLAFGGHPDGLAKALEAELGVTLELDEAEKTPSCRGRHQRRDGFQVNWGLPAPSLVGLAAGSCFRFKVTKGKCLPEALQRLAMSGLGARRAEGFGQVALNPSFLRDDPPQLKRWEKAGAAGESPDEASTPLAKNDRDDKEFAYLRQAEEAAWRAAVNRAALAVAYQLAVAYREELLGESRPAKGVLGDLRAHLVAGADDDSLDLLYSWLDHAKDKQLKALGKLREKLCGYCQNDGQIWDDLGLVDKDLGDDALEKITATAGGVNELKKQLGPWAVRATLLCICRVLQGREDASKAQNKGGGR
ncbi:RAMP superfamily CRISPR-associated protein [Desulfarculus baarsii]